MVRARAIYVELCWDTVRDLWTESKGEEEEERSHAKVENNQIKIVVFLVKSSFKLNMLEI